MGRLERMSDYRAPTVVGIGCVYECTVYVVEGDQLVTPLTSVGQTERTQ